jgi:predicted DNA-binding protein (UPF0251 family)
MNPQAEYFKPRGVPLVELQEVNLTIDEFEALRLADLEGLYQEDAARKMNISRQTFGNIVESAHRKIADTIVNAKALRIERRYCNMVRQFRCSDCRHELSVAFGTKKPSECPKCQSKNICRAQQGRGCERAGRGRKTCRRIKA